MKIGEIQKEIHRNAIEKGWHKSRQYSDIEFGEVIALCHSELSEALELYRNNCKVNQIGSEEIGEFGKTKPTGIPVEFADCIIRILDACELYGIDIEKAISVKMEYNKTRAFRHGGKRL